MGGVPPGTVADAEVCGRICYEAFSAISSAHRFPCDFPSADVAVAMLRSLLSHSGFYSVVAPHPAAGFLQATFSTSVRLSPASARSPSTPGCRTPAWAVS
jgi:hypothetical protein